MTARGPRSPKAFLLSRPRRFLRGRLSVLIAVLVAGALLTACTHQEPRARSSVPVTGVSGVTCQGHPATLVGTPGDDIIDAGPGNDVIAGLGGNDLIIGSHGNDVICGGPG